MDRKQKPLSWWYRSLFFLKHNDDKTQEEGLPIVWAALLLRLYLEDAHFTFWTNQDALKYIFHLVNAHRKALMLASRPITVSIGRSF